MLRHYTLEYWQDDGWLCRPTSLQKWSEQLPSKSTENKCRSRKYNPTCLRVALSFSYRKRPVRFLQYDSTSRVRGERLP